MLAVMIGCGLRREEVARLRFRDIGQREGRWVVLDLRGKHGRVRSVPMPSWAKAAIDEWAAAAEISEGAVFRGVNMITVRSQKIWKLKQQRCSRSDPSFQ
jgi:integrase